MPGMPLSWAVHRLLTLLIIISVLLLGGGLGPALGNNAILCFMLLGSFIIHMGTRPERAEWLSVLAVAAVFRIVYPAIAKFEPLFGVRIMSWGSFLGLASLLVLLV